MFKIENELQLLKSKHQIQISSILHSNQHVKHIPLSNNHVNSDDFYLTLFKINLPLWRHFDISSVLLFNKTFGSARAIIIFSVRHKSHLLVPHLYWDARTILYSNLDGNQSYLLSRSKGIWIVPHQLYGYESERSRMITVSRFELPL